MTNIEELIDAAIEDGVLTDTERRVLDRKALEAGWNLDEFHVILEGRLQKKVKEMNAAKPAPKRTSNKYGEVRKCPTCGAMIKPGKAVCEECGYEVTGVGGVSSAERLAAALAKTSWERDQISIIKNFPIPNTVEDLMEFCLMCESRGKNDPESRIEYAYHNKYKETLSKAKVYFPNDVRFQEIFQRSESLFNKQSYLYRYRKTAGCLIGIIVFVFFIILMNTCK